MELPNYNPTYKRLTKSPAPPSWFIHWRITMCLTPPLALLWNGFLKFCINIEIWINFLSMSLVREVRALIRPLFRRRQSAAHLWAYEGVLQIIQDKNVFQVSISHIRGLGSHVSKGSKCLVPGCYFVARFQRFFYGHCGVCKGLVAGVVLAVWGFRI